jgi:hypothetical protein
MREFARPRNRRAETGCRISRFAFEEAQIQAPPSNQVAKRLGVLLDTHA